MPRYTYSQFIYRASVRRPQRWQNQREYEDLLQSGIFEVLFPTPRLATEPLDRITRDDCRRLDLQTKQELYAIMLRTKRLVDNGRLNLHRDPPEALLFALQVETRRILYCGTNNLNNQRSQSRSQSRGHRARPYTSRPSTSTSRPSTSTSRPSTSTSRPSTSTSSLVTENQDSESVMVTFFCDVLMVEHTD